MGLQRVRHDWMHTHTECGAGVKNLYQRRKCKRWGFDPWVGKIPWTRKWQLIPIFVPAESHGQRSMTSHSPWDCRVGHSWAHTLKTNEIVSANLYSHNMWKLQFLHIFANNWHCFPQFNHLAGYLMVLQASQAVLVVKKLLANAGNMRPGFGPWFGKIPWTRGW